MKSRAKNRMRVSVIIPSWNARHFVGQCLDSLRIQSFTDFEVIVVENGSTDGSLEYIKENYPEVRLLPQNHNTGFARAVNLGIKYSHAEYVALLNNDAIAERNWLEELVAHMDSHQDTAASVSKILKQEKHAEKDKFFIDTTGDFYSVWGMPFPRGRDELDEGQYDQESQVFGACGGAVMYKREVLVSKVGLFDEAFFAYYEDIDLSFRIRRAGYEIFYIPTAVVHHKVGATSGGGKNKFTRYHTVKNIWFVYIKNMPGIYFWKYLPQFLITQILVCLNSLRSGLVIPQLKGSIVAIAYTPVMLIRRWRIALRSRVTSSGINHLLVMRMPPTQRKTLQSYGLIRRDG